MVSGKENWNPDSNNNIMSMQISPNTSAIHMQRNSAMRSSKQNGALFMKGGTAISQIGRDQSPIADFSSTSALIRGDNQSPD